MDFGGGEEFTEQQLALRKRITESKAVDQLDVLFLLDDSGSIKDTDFNVLIQVCETLLLSLTTKQSHFAVIAFHTSSTVICDFTKDKTTVLKAIRDYKRTKGSTNIVAGLEKAITLFKAARKHAKRIAFTITDGAAESDPSQTATHLKLLNVTSYCIGVGSEVNLAALQKISSLGCATLVRDMEQIIRLFNAQEKDVIHEFHVTMQATIIKIPLRFQEPVGIRIVIRCIGPKSIPPGTFFAFFGGEYFHTTTYRLPEDISHDGEHTFEIILRTTGKSFALIPDSISFTITHPTSGGTIFCDHDEIPLSSEYFIGSFVNFKPSNPEVGALNILLFGIRGSGKSSFLNSIISAFSSEVCDPALVGGDQEHITRKYRRFCMGEQLVTLNGLRINLWDTWGLDTETYTGRFLVKLLEGNVPSDFDMENVNMDGTVTHQAASEEAPHERRIHGVLLFVPVGILEEEALTMRVHEALKELNIKSLQTMFIVTRADTIEATARFAHQHAIARKFNVPDYKVCLVTNYTKSREKDFSIDKVTLRIFAEITKIADTYAKTYVRSPTPHLRTSSNNNNNNTNSNNNINNNNLPRREVWSPINSTSSSLQQRYSGLFENEPLTSVTVEFDGKKATMAVNESTTFESLLVNAAQKAKVDVADYCLASLPDGGVEYGVKDLVRAALQPGQKQIYMRKDEGFV